MNTLKITLLIPSLIVGSLFLSNNLLAAEDYGDRIKKLERTILKLQDQLASASRSITKLNNSNVMDLNQYLTVDSASDPRGPVVLFKGVNLQVVNGSGTTDGSVNGLGNIIIGYDEENRIVKRICSEGNYDSQSDCEDSGYTWSNSHKSGSHYLVIGKGNNYSQYAGMVVGLYNSSNRKYASVSGGMNNNAAGEYSSVSGGRWNLASGYISAISGGQNNIASASLTSITAGINNLANKSYASVHGGHSNQATNHFATVSGGTKNIASGWYSNVSGGIFNTASGHYSTVSGGGDGTETGGNDASGTYSSILGGSGENSPSNSQTIPPIY